MKGFDVLKVKSAVKARNKFNLNRSHLTTMDFGQIVPLFVDETIPGDEFNIGAGYFSRMAPLVKPTYGKFQFKTVAGFVPYHQIAEDAEAWLAGKTTFEGQTPKQRTITLSALASFIVDYCVDSTVESAERPDFIYTDANGVQHLSAFTTKGKYYVKILNALGYAIPQGVNFSSASTWNSQTGLLKLSAYPLLAFAKLYNDYMSQSQRFNTSILSDFLHCVKHGNQVTGYTPTTGALAASGINRILSSVLLNYENDYFTSAWQSPNNALNGTESVSSVYVSGVPDVRIVSNEAYDYVEQTNSNYFHAISQRALDFLKSFDLWVKRNNYSGSRSVQQVYSRFGIKSDDYRSNYAHVIKTDVMPIQVGDVTATADSENVPLGDYSGKGIMNGSSGISFKADDYGLLMILGYFTVTPMNAFGFDRRVLRNTPLAYYNPEFDGLGADAISLGEVWESPIAQNADVTKTTDVFGFTERYNAYRYGRDVITGEFRDYHSDADMNTWHTGRDLAFIRQQGNLVAQSSAMNTLEPVGSEYNRIFSVTDDSVDHFYLTCKFDVSAVRPILNLNQVVGLGEGNTDVPRNGNVIS